MSAYTMLADHPQFTAPEFSTADAVTLDPALDSTHSLSGDFMSFGLTIDEEPVWTMSPISPSMANWNAKTDPSFVSGALLERDYKHVQVRNGQPTPPLDEQQPFQEQRTVPGNMTALFDNRNTWDDTPTPPSSEDRGRNSSADNSMTGVPAYAAGSKRRKLREHKASIATTISSSGADSDDQDQDHAKREKFLERNRVAASKCRQKKKEHTMMLESQYKEQSDKREQLNSEISRLRGEILGLKNEVLRHAQCGDEPIKLHLAQMVKQIANKDRQDPDKSTEKLPETLSAVQTTVSFGFDEPLPIENGASLEQQFRRDSDGSIALSGGDDFDDLLNC